MTDRREVYNAYIASPAWRALRAKAIDLTPYCALCSSVTSLEAHHRKYPKILGTEPVEWITVLCKKCHGIHHGKKYGKKKEKKNRQGNKKKRKGAGRTRANTGGKVKVYTPEEIIEYQEGYRPEKHD